MDTISLLMDALKIVYKEKRISMWSEYGLRARLLYHLQKAIPESCEKIIFDDESDEKIAADEVFVDLEVALGGLYNGCIKCKKDTCYMSRPNRKGNGIYIRSQSKSNLDFALHDRSKTDKIYLALESKKDKEADQHDFNRLTYFTCPDGDFRKRKIIDAFFCGFKRESCTLIQFYNGCLLFGYELSKNDQNEWEWSEFELESLGLKYNDDKSNLPSDSNLPAPKA